MSDEDLGLPKGDEMEPTGVEPELHTEPEPAAAAPVEPDVAETLRKENDALRVQLNDLVRMVGRPADRAPEAPAEPAQRPASAEIDFTIGIDVADLFDKPAPVLNSLLNKVFQAGREAALQDLPQIVQQHAAQAVDIRMKAKQFWDDNADLKEFADFVGLIANNVAQENPSMDLDNVYKETAKRARERLKVIKGASAAPSQNPALPSSRTGRKPAVPNEPLTGEEKEKEDMWKAFGG